MSEHVLTLDGVGPDEAPSQTDGRAGNTAATPAKKRRKETWEYQLLFAVTFAIFLVAAFIETLIPSRNRAGSEISKKHEGIVQRASNGAHTCVKYAFMG